jgi:hypothetical protein
MMVDIPMNSEVIIGLADIKRWNIFDRLPHLVRAESLHDEESDNESNENKSGPDTRVHTETRTVRYTDQNGSTKIPTTKTRKQISWKQIVMEKSS